MNITSTNLIIRETKGNAMAKVGAVNNATTNGTNNNTANNNAVDQSKVPKTDTVEVSHKSVALAAAARSDTASKVAETPTATTTAAQNEPKVEAATEKVTAAEKSKDTKTNYRQAMKKGQQELRSVVKDLKDAGVGRREIGKIIRHANRQANKTIGNEMKQTYNDYRGKKINRSEFANKLHGSAVKKLDGIVTALKDKLVQKTAPEDKSTEAAKEVANVPATPLENAASQTAQDNAQGLVITGEKAPETTPPEQVVVEEEATTTTETTETTTSELIIKEEKVVEAETDGEMEVSKIVNDGGEVDNTFSEMVSFFNDIDKMINGFADGVEGDEEVEGSNGEDKGESTVKFAAKLNDMFSSINKVFGGESNGNVGNKLGMAQMNKETIGQLFDSGHGSGAIHRIGDAGEGTGNFNTANFMSSMSSGINDGLESYKEAQKAEKEAKEEVAQEQVAQEEAVGV